MRKFRGFKLHIILILLTMVSIVVTSMLSAQSAYRAQEQSLRNSYLESNEQYAQKLSYTTQTTLQNMQNDLVNSAKQLQFLQEEQLPKELDQIWEFRKNYFNSMLYVDKQLKVLAISSPFSTVKVGDTMQTAGFLTASKQRKPFISDPYIGATGKMLILVTVPIFTDAGEYNGMLAGTIYLHEPNVLNETLTQNFYSNGSFVFVVDETGQIIYHPQREQIGEVLHKKIGDILGSAMSGKTDLTNISNQEIFAGFAQEKFTNWTIVVATPSDIVEGPSYELVKNMMVMSLPFYVVIIVVVLFLAIRISRPLHQLARYSENILDVKGGVNVQLPALKSVVYEVKQLHHSIQETVFELQRHIHQLDIDLQTDALTNILNRRTFNLAISDHIESYTPFSLIFVDIDFFKKVNDTYGHLVGDDVLKFLAKMMRELSREGDLCFRYGGEEFAIIIPNNDRDTAYTVAERLRKALETTPSPTGEAVKISLGIAVYPEDGMKVKEIIAAADAALYRSKSTGRNKTTIYKKNM